jgi:hypothetical protein
MLWSVLASATQLSAPIPLHDYRWFSWQEMPFAVQAAGVPRVVFTKTTVAPDGSVQRCDVERSSGNSIVDSTTCAVILKKGIFRPARSANGSAIFGMHRQIVIWAPIPFVQVDASGDFEIPVDRLPHGFHTPFSVKVAFAVDPQGHLSNCVRQASPSEIGRMPEFAAIACQRLLDGRTISPVEDSAGTPVPSVQDATVLFVNHRHAR